MRVTVEILKLIGFYFELSLAVNKVVVWKDAKYAGICEKTDRDFEVTRNTIREYEGTDGIYRDVVEYAVFGVVLNDDDFDRMGIETPIMSQVIEVVKIYESARHKLDPKYVLVRGRNNIVATINKLQKCLDSLE